MKKLLFIICFISVSFSQIFERFHPELNWKQFETENFIVVFHDGSKNSAIRAAEIAETVFDDITAVYNYKPENKLYLILKDVDDYSNGGAYFLDDKIEIFTEHLDYDLRGTHEWLKDVITHEFIHMIHIQKSLTMPKYLPFATLQWIGYEDERRKDVVRGFPNRIVGLPLLFFRIPPWLAEGVAQYQTDRKRFDYRDAQRDMILRDRFINDNILSLDEMSIFGKSSIGNESVYNQGFSFVEHLVENFGEESLAKISASNASFSALIDYSDEVFTKNFNKSLEEIYKDWNKSQKNLYSEKTKNIKSNLQEGKIIHEHGEGNFYSEYSPDSKYFSYVSSQEQRSMYNNTIIIKNTETNEELEIAGPITGQVKWFNDSQRIIYTKKTELNSFGSAYNDLYVYDITKKEESRITYNLRARNPIVTDNDEIVFVTTYDGTANLVRFKYNQEVQEFLFDQKNMKFESPRESNFFWEREAKISGSDIRFLTNYSNFEQLFHSTLLDNNQILIAFSDSYKREIKLLDLNQSTLKDFIVEEYDIRNPHFDGKNVFVSSNKTGIYNIYQVKDNALIPVTNVLGGAFMPTLNGTTLSYSLYKNAAFNIAEIENFYPLDSDDLFYEEIKHNKDKMTLETKFESIVNPDISRQRYKFNSFYAVPGLLYDDNRLKFGATILVNEVLNRASLMFSAFYNQDGERDIYGNIEFRNISLFDKDPVLFIEVVNQHVRIDDRIKIKFDENPQYINGDREVGFTLWQWETGFKMKLFNSLDMKLSYVSTKYEAELGPALTDKFYDNGEYKAYEFPFFRYTYHDGNAIDLNLLYEEADQSVLGEILPSKGQRYYSKLSLNQYRFLDDFAFNSTGLQEVYSNYFYTYASFHSEHHFNLIESLTSLTIDTNLEGNLKATDEFYDVYAGGMVGLKGYPYFSIHGRQKWISSIKINQLIAKDLSFDIGIMKIRNLAFESYVQFGDAWTTKLKIKKNIGLKLKADSYSYLKLYFDMAYPLDKVDGVEQLSDGEKKEFTYKQEIKYYFGLSYFFELKEIL